jgi:SAM-dependent methyltransferase
MTSPKSAHYGAQYFSWHSSIGEFGGWANLSKFEQYITPESEVMDFGCGGGYLLERINCQKKVGVDVNAVALAEAERRGIEVFRSASEVPCDYVDIAISNNALEHTLHPLDELREVHRVLRPGGKAIFVVPCESISNAYKADDRNHHLYSWSPMCAGNLLTEAGFMVVEAKSYIHKWPPNYRWIAKVGGRPLFELACRMYGRLDRSWFQVRVIAEKR